MYYVYILRNKDGKYYIGSTLSIAKRLERHNKGGSVWTNKYKPWVLIYSEKLESKTEAMKREKEIKSYKGGNKLKELINKNS